MNVLVADCVAKAYGEQRVLTAGTLRATAGRISVLFGRNGSGKSTLMKIAAGCLRADSGAVHFAGRVYPEPRLSRLARDGLFYLPDRDLLSSEFTVGMQLQMLRDRYDGERVEWAAEMTGIASHLDQRPQRLSGGERRRAEFAAALVRQPVCFLADEPFRGVAPKDAEILASVLREMAARGCAVVVTGHDVETLLAAADHVIWSIAGTTYELGTPAVARCDERFRREYLGSTLRS